MADQIALTPSQFDDLSELRRKFLGVTQSEGTPNYQRGKYPGQSAVVMLLESIESGQMGRAAVLAADRSRLNFFITVYGVINSDDYFRLRWSPAENVGSEEVDTVSAYSTPLEMKAKLEEFSFINPGDVSVSLGNHARIINGEAVEFNVFRWLVSLKVGATGNANLIQPAGQSSGNWVGAEYTRLRDTGQTIQVESPLPIGNTRSGKTPQQPGALAVVDWVDGVGWVINAIESRWIDTTADDEVDYVGY